MVTTRFIILLPIKILCTFFCWIYLGKNQNLKLITGKILSLFSGPQPAKDFLQLCSIAFNLW